MTSRQMAMIAVGAAGAAVVSYLVYGWWTEKRKQQKIAEEKKNHTEKQEQENVNVELDLRSDADHQNNLNLNVSEASGVFEGESTEDPHLEYANKKGDEKIPEVDEDEYANEDGEMD